MWREGTITRIIAVREVLPRQFLPEGKSTRLCLLCFFIILKIIKSLAIFLFPLCQTISISPYYLDIICINNCFILILGAAHLK